MTVHAVEANEATATESKAGAIEMGALEGDSISASALQRFGRAVVSLTVSKGVDSRSSLEGFPVLL
jgi:hypothetical protein